MIQRRIKQNERDWGIPYLSPKNKLYKGEKFTSVNSDTWGENLDIKKN